MVNQSGFRVNHPCRFLHDGNILNYLTVNIFHTSNLNFLNEFVYDWRCESVYVKIVKNCYSLDSPSVALDLCLKPQSCRGLLSVRIGIRLKNQIILIGYQSGSVSFKQLEVQGGKFLLLVF